MKDQTEYPMPNLDALFSSYRLNALDLPNRVVMAPMSRYVSLGGVPTAEVAAYYRRRGEWRRSHHNGGDRDRPAGCTQRP
jgi:hypothetical protein